MVHELMNKLALKLLVNVCLVRVEHVTFNHELPTYDDEKQLALDLRYQTTTGAPSTNT
jgi:hypothetical protein